MRSNGVSIIVGATVGSLLAVLTPTAVDSTRDFYDATHPVWSGVTALGVTRTGDSVTMGLQGVKERECRFLRVTARVSYPDGGTTEAAITRLDAPMTGTTRPIGAQQIGMFEVRPAKAGAESIYIWTEHECGSRVVMSRLVVVRVPK